MTCQRYGCWCESIKWKRCVAQGGSRVSAGNFPAGVEAPGKSGPNLRALAVYLHQYQLVPLSRTCELLGDRGSCQLSEGTLTAWVRASSADARTDRRAHC